MAEDEPTFVTAAELRDRETRVERASRKNERGASAGRDREERPGGTSGEERSDEPRAKRPASSEARVAAESEGEPDGEGGSDTGAEQFAIPTRPDRHYPRSGGVEYVGGTVFSFDPGVDRSEEDLAGLLESVLDSESYRYGDWFDLPMPLYLVHDDSTHDTFRVAVRDGRVEVHVLPETEPEGVRALHDRLVEAGEERFEWRVERRVEEP